MHFSGRAVMTGPLLKLPLINDLQPIGAKTKTLTLNLSTQVFSHVFCFVYIFKMFFSEPFLSLETISLSP